MVPIRVTARRILPSPDNPMTPPFPKFIHLKNGKSPKTSRPPPAIQMHDLLVVVKLLIGGGSRCVSVVVEWRWWAGGRLCHWGEWGCIVKIVGRRWRLLLGLRSQSLLGGLLDECLPAAGALELGTRGIALVVLPTRPQWGHVNVVTAPLIIWWHLYEAKRDQEPILGQRKNSHLIGIAKKKPVIGSRPPSLRSLLSPESSCKHHRMDFGHLENRRKSEPCQGNKLADRWVDGSFLAPSGIVRDHSVIVDYWP